jgi:hypothetical protein
VSRVAPTVTIRRRLRPLRLAFLVGLRDSTALQRIIETNTCIWGGRCNALIPYVARGFSHAGRSWSCDAIVHGYIARFEPDFLVDTTGHGKRFFDPSRVLDETAILDRAKNGEVRHGVSVIAVLPASRSGVQRARVEKPPPEVTAKRAQAALRRAGIVTR